GFLLALFFGTIFFAGMALRNPLSNPADCNKLFSTPHRADRSQQESSLSFSVRHTRGRELKPLRLAPHHLSQNTKKRPRLSTRALFLQIARMRPTRPPAPAPLQLRAPLLPKQPLRLP